MYIVIKSTSSVKKLQKVILCSPVFTAYYTFTIPYPNPRKTENQYHTIEYVKNRLFQKGSTELCFQTLAATLTHSDPLPPTFTNFDPLSPSLIHLHLFFTQPTPIL